MHGTECATLLVIRAPLILLQERNHLHRIFQYPDSGVLRSRDRVVAASNGSVRSWTYGSVTKYSQYPMDL